VQCHFKHKRIWWDMVGLNFSIFHFIVFIFFRWGQRWAWNFDKGESSMGFLALYSQLVSGFLFILLEV
jgi:hypothetical protein